MQAADESHARPPSLSELANAMRPKSEFWSSNYLRNNSVVLNFGSVDEGSQFAELDHAVKLRKFESYTPRFGTELGWTEVSHHVSTTEIFAITTDWSTKFGIQGNKLRKLGSKKVVKLDKNLKK